MRAALYDQAVALLRDFDQTNDLGGLSIAKTWGLASWGPYLASCVTFHPGDMVEYNLPSHERCHIIFSRENTEGDTLESAKFPWQEVPNETLQANSQIILQELLAMASGSDISDNWLDRRVVFSICCAATIVADAETLQLAEAVLHELLASVNVDLESEISLLSDTRILDLTAPQRIERLNLFASSKPADAVHSALRQIYDWCSICDQVVLWEGLTGAYCIAGHQFGMGTA